MRFQLCPPGFSILIKVYYGQEIYLKGGDDPNNREALWDHGYRGNALIKTLNNLRLTAISQDPKFIMKQSVFLYHDDYQLFYQKGQVLVGLSGQSSERKILPYFQIVRGTTYSPGEPLIEILTCGSAIAGPGQVVVTMRNGAPVVLYPRERLAGTGICGL